MAKKSAKINLIYLIGMVVAAVGFCVPMFCFGRNVFTKEIIIKGAFSKKIMNGFYFIDFNNFIDKLANGKIMWITLAAILLLSAIVLGLVFALVNIKQSSTLRLVALIIMVVAVAIIFWRIYKNDFSTFFGTDFGSLLGKGIWKHAYIGTYMIIGGWACGLAGWFIGR